MHMYIYVYMYVYMYIYTCISLYLIQSAYCNLHLLKSVSLLCDPITSTFLTFMPFVCLFVLFCKPLSLPVAVLLTISLELPIWKGCAHLWEYLPQDSSVVYAFSSRSRMLWVSPLSSICGTVERPSLVQVHGKYPLLLWDVTPMAVVLQRSGS